MNQGLSAFERFGQKYRLAEDGCWVWIASTTGWSGYGRFYVDGERKNVLAHRYAYETFVGPIPAGLDLDHLCRNRLCVRPDHLEPVTRRENIIRGTSPNARNAAKTHCRRGHPLTRENCYEYRWPNQRQCKLCARADAHQQRQRRRQTNDLASAERNAKALKRAIEGLSGPHVSPFDSGPWSPC